jgi:hypothetical protein
MDEREGRSMVRLYKHRIRGWAIAVASAGLVVGAASANAAADVMPVFGDYYTNELVQSLTGTKGATAAECGKVYARPGTLIGAITLFSLVDGQPQFDVRDTYEGTTLARGLGIFRQVLAQGPGSTFTKQSGTITEYDNGVKFIVFPYTGTVTVIDTQSFLGTLSADLPSPTGKGTCVQVISATFVHTSEQ